MTKTRVFFVTDVHGSDKLFLKFVNAAAVYKAQVLIIGGDVAGKAITPIFRKNDTYSADIQGVVKVAANQSDVEALKKEVRFLGNYPLVTTEEEWNKITQDEKEMDRIFDVLIKESLGRWCKIASERLTPLGARVIINKGNDDPPILEETLLASDFVEYANEKVISVDDKHEMISLGYANITPWHLPGDLPEETLEKKFEEIMPKVSNVKNSIFNVHVPPHNTHLDIAPKLDENLTPVLAPGGEPEFAHVGSTAVRSAIEKYGPLLGLHGHIHESRGYTKLGRTHCFNPGSEYGIGVLKGALLNLSDGKLQNYLFTSA